MSSPVSLDSLPNELLSSILSQLPTTALLPRITINHRVYSTALHILNQRLLRATSQPDRRVMLECYHPSEKLYTPYLYCNYLCSDPFPEFGASPPAEPAGESSQHEGSTRRASDSDGTKGLRTAYSHFQPVEQDESRPRRGSRSWWRPNGSSGSYLPTPTSPTSTATTSNTNGSHEPFPPPPPPPPTTRPSLDIYLDEDESFSQLVCVTNLVRLGQRPGLFRSHVNVSEAVVRVGRDWLARRARASGAVEPPDDDDILWVDSSRAIGLRFRVTEKDLRSERPVLVGSDEQLPVAYRLGFDELLIRSTTLLVMAEREEVEEVSAEGKAIVLATF
ncbi:cyclin-like F-box protein [Dichotomopilus funicola]|uniref:Cyclin-like F-box protein n=1 Tax=Dichotomopilus funicola TaxID=1934379 RepID=A0AAN6V6Z1_9PEZI|nr:cyclin-like F-box protein [Dichotomopilus funicola]